MALAGCAKTILTFRGAMKRVVAGLGCPARNAMREKQPMNEWNEPLDTTVKRGRPPKPKVLPVKFHKNYWSMGGRRFRKGEEGELPADEARDVVTKLIAERNDPF